MFPTGIVIGALLMAAVTWRDLDRRVMVGVMVFFSAALGLGIGLSESKVSIALGATVVMFVNIAIGATLAWSVLRMARR